MNTAAVNPEYRSSLRHLFTFLDEEIYAKDHVFGNEKILSLTPAHLCRWFTHLAFGTDSPSPEQLPTKCRSNTLLGHKKKISFFYPRKDHQWDSIRGRGTRHARKTSTR